MNRLADIDNPDSSGASPRIVIVNDEPCMVEMMEVLIHAWLKNAELLTFTDPEQAFKSLLQHDPDLLITDDMMPKLNGHEIVERVVIRGASYPIIMTSAYSPSREWVQEWVNLGVRISYFSQPFTVDGFKQEIAKHLGTEVSS